MSGAYAGRPMSPADAQADLMKSHVTRGISVNPKRDTDQHTFILASPPEWASRGRCVDNYFTYDEPVGLKEGEAMARCVGCPVIEECLSAAMAEEGDLSAGNRYTIRGGLSPKERAQLAFAERACERGHTGRWTDNGRGTVPRCLECAAENSRRLYEVKRQDPEFLARRSQALREARAIQRVSCLECRADLRAASLPRHVARVHGEAA